MYTDIVIHGIIRSASGRVVTRQGSLPGLEVSGRLPDGILLDWASSDVGLQDPVLLGGFPHRTQIADAPIMLTLPSLSIWHKGTVHMYYLMGEKTYFEDGLSSLRQEYEWTTPDDVIDTLLLNSTNKPMDLLKVLIQQTNLPTYTLRQFEHIQHHHYSSRETTVAIFVKMEDKVLLHKHRKLGIWLPPGGHKHPCESILTAALRETKEEAGVRIRLIDPCDNRLEYQEPFSSETQLLPCPASIQLEEPSPGHQHLDYVYYASLTEYEISQPRGSEETMEWISLRDSSNNVAIRLSPEMTNWMKKVLS